MNWRELIHNLQFNNNLSFDKQINAISFVKLHVFIHDRKRLLSLEPEPSQSKLTGHTNLIGGFEQAWAKLPMNFNRGPYDFVG